MWLFSLPSKKTVHILGKFVGLTVLILMANGCSGVSIRQLDSEVQTKLEMITVQDIKSREGQLYTRELRKLLHISGKKNSKYTIKTNIYNTSSSALSIEGESSTLKKMTMVASFTLYETEFGKTLLTDSVIADATSGTVSSLFGHSKAEAHSKERLAILLAQRIVRRLQLYFLEQSR